MRDLMEDWPIWVWVFALFAFVLAQYDRLERRSAECDAGKVSACVRLTRH